MHWKEENREEEEEEVVSDGQEGGALRWDRTPPRGAGGVLVKFTRELSVRGTVGGRCETGCSVAVVCFLDSVREKKHCRRKNVLMSLHRCLFNISIFAVSSEKLQNGGN